MVRVASIKIEVNKRILPIPNSITLKCTGLDEDMINDNFEIIRTVDGQATVFTDYTTATMSDAEPVRIASFLLTPDREGNYTCKIGQEMSTNFIILVGESEKWLGSCGVSV